MTKASPNPSDPDEICAHSHEHIPVSRRRLLATGGAIVAATIAGCSGGDATTPVPEPVTLSSGMDCDACGMIISSHPGPNGQIFYEDDDSIGHDNPARFEGLRSCLFPYYFEQERYDPTVLAVYVTDYSRVDFDLFSEAGETFISSHMDAESFAHAEDATFVVGSDVKGPMGDDFIPFSDSSDATDFVDERGGDLVSFDEIDQSMLTS